MPFEQFPYTNFHELNEDWIIKTVKEVKDKAENIDASVEEANSAAERAGNSADNAATSADNAASSADDAEAAYNNVVNYNQNLSEQVNENTRNIAVNSGRIDTFTQLTAGSTTGDAELQDIRVWYNGNTSSTAGDAVRGQVNDVNNKISGITQILEYSPDILPLTVKQGYYINETGAEVANTAESYGSTNITADHVGKEITVNGTGWWTIQPYVFVGSSGNIITPGGSYGGTVTHVEANFTPYEPGILYVNKYSSDNIPMKATYGKVSAVAGKYISNIGDDIVFEAVVLNMTDSKLLNGETGAITDTSSDAYKVSDYIDIQNVKRLIITTEHFWSNGLYAFYDENRSYISGINSNTGGTITKLNAKFIDVPFNAKYVVIGYLYQANFPAPYLFKGISKNVLPSKKWSDYKWSCIGDSLTEYNTKASLHYFDYIQMVTGIEVNNMGVSGTGYARGTDNFMSRVLTVPTDSDVVTIFGSGNDSGAGLPLGTATDTGTSTLGGVINTTIDNLYSIMPIVNLGIITPTPWQGSMPSDNGWMENYSNLIVAICRRRSIPCLDLFHCSNLNPNSAEVRQAAYSNDGGSGVHPDNAGHKLFAPRIKAFLDTLLI